jgi:hypothetical protein
VEVEEGSRRWKWKKLRQRKQSYLPFPKVESELVSYSGKGGGYSTSLSETYTHLTYGTWRTKGLE